MRIGTMTPAKTLLLEMSALVALAALLAFGMNLLQPRPLPLLGSGAPPAPAPAPRQAAPAIPVVGTTAFHGLVASGQVLVVDARLAQDYDAGHVPGAVNVPPGLMDDEIAALLGPPPGDRPIVIYCSNVLCPMSHDLAVVLGIMGYEGVRVYAGGMHGWLATEGEVEVGR